MLKLKRYHMSNKVTMGVLLWMDTPICLTLEPPYKDNKKWESCIPQGTYRVTKYSGTKFKNAFWIHDVPNRFAIMIHPGNTVIDTQGCILPGLELAHNAVLQSSKAMAILNTQLPFETEIRISDNV